MGAQASSGGLACLWNPKKVTPLWWISSRSSISFMASHFETGERCFFSNIYAPSVLEGISLMWSHIIFVHSLDPFLPWIVAGDFNAITNLEEKRGEITRLGPSSSMLRDNISSLNLIDVKPSSGVFT